MAHTYIIQLQDELNMNTTTTQTLVQPQLVRIEQCFEEEEEKCLCQP